MNSWTIKLLVAGVVISMAGNALLAYGMFALSGDVKQNAVAQYESHGSLIDLRNQDLSFVLRKIITLEEATGLRTTILRLSDLELLESMGIENDLDYREATLPEIANVN